VSDEPTNGELGRRLDQIYGSLQALIGRAEYDAGQRALDLRLAGVNRDLEDLRRQHAEDVEKLNTRITEEAKTTAARGQWKTTILVGLIPSLVALLAILVTIWLRGGGG
jgi:hypothetical protein